MATTTIWKCLTDYYGAISERVIVAPNEAMATLLFRHLYSLPTDAFVIVERMN